MKFLTLAATTLMTLGSMAPAYAKSEVSNVQSTLSKFQSETPTAISADIAEINIVDREVEYHARGFRRRRFRRARFRRGFHGRRFRRGFHDRRFRRGFHDRRFRSSRFRRGFHRGNVIRIRFR